MPSRPRLFLLPALALCLLAVIGSARAPAERSPTVSRPPASTAVGGVVRETAPSPDVVGTAAGVAHRSGLLGFRWNPCRPVTYRVNARGGYRGSTADIRTAFRRIGRITGIRFVYEGQTRRIAFRTRLDPRTDITVSWATPRQVPLLRGAIAALANNAVVRNRGIREAVKGQIALDRTTPIGPGYTLAGPPTWGQAFLHEIGHVVGLAHVGDRTQVMYPTINRDNHVLGLGDRLNLVAVGIAAGCIPHSWR